MIAMQIVRDVARRRRISLRDIRGPCRFPHMVAARMEIAQRLRIERGMSSGQIGRFINRSTWQVQYYLQPEYRRRAIARNLARYFEQRAAA